MIPNWSQNDPKMIPKWLQHYPKMIPQWSKNNFKMIPTFVYYSPSDRAQKVIPGGAKTNESFWKFQNDVNKSILRFPIIFVYYSPGDRAQTIISGGAKTNESFWKSQNGVEKSTLRFLSFLLFLFTIALVIERKKLSPEARKQTRASESLKIASKNKFYASHHLCLL